MNFLKKIKFLIPSSNISEKIYIKYKIANYFYRHKFISYSNYLYYKLFKKYNCYISPRSIIQGIINFPHPFGIVIGIGVKIGRNVTIYHNVTIGRKNKDKKEYPTIGDNVIIYCNTTIIGNIKIGNNAVIGCNSVVMRDVKDNEKVYGIVK